METHSSNPEEELLIDQPYKQLEKNIFEIDKMRTIGSDIVTASVGMLNGILKEANLQKSYGVARKVETSIKALEGFENSDSYLSKKVAAIRNQSLILIVTNFERFLNDFVIILIENYAYLIDWPEKKSSIDFSMFKYGSPTIGEIVLRSFREKYNFQDLKSVKVFLNDILNISIKLQADEKKIILNHAKRHVLIHNSGVVDDKFQKQIRMLEETYSYAKGDIIEVTEDEYLEAKKVFLNFAEKIYKETRKNIVPF